MRRTLANMASFYTEQQSVDVREGLARRVQEGWFVGKVPYGYRNVRKDGRCVTEVDPVPPEILSDVEVRALMDACGRYAPRAIRNRALIAILYRGGLRINEALALYPKDLDLVGGAIRVLHGKGDKPRTIGIDPGAIAILQTLARCPRATRLQRHPSGVLHDRRQRRLRWLHPIAAAVARANRRHPEAGSCPRIPPHPRGAASRRRRGHRHHLQAAWDTSASRPRRGIWTTSRRLR